MTENDNDDFSGEYPIDQDPNEDESEAPEDAPTVPELRVVMQRSRVLSQKTNDQAKSVLETLEKRSVNPPKL